MYVQGSIALGTAIRPPAKDDFDFDVTLELKPESYLTAMEVRQAVADRLREDANYSRMLNMEKNRCLRLDYAKDEQFHFDIVAARTARWVNLTGTGIQVPDRGLASWVLSDPRGFIAWFVMRKNQIQRRTPLLMENRNTLITANAEPAPEQPESHEKRPLQWVIQIMKRHRDLHFADIGPENAPISVILTTLAAKAYMGEPDVDSALEGITHRLLQQFDDAGRWQVLNPVIPSENFADKWRTKPHRRQAFFTWFNQFQQDVGTYLDASKMESIANGLEKLMGERAKNTAFSAHSEFLNDLQRRGKLGVISRSATLAPAVVTGSRIIPYHNNFGSL